MPSNHLIFCCPLLLLPSIFPSIRVFSNKSVLHVRWPKYSASASVLPMNIQGWFPLGLTGLILQSKGLSRVFSSTTIQKHQFFGTQPYFLSSFWRDYPGLYGHPNLTTRVLSSERGRQESQRQKRRCEERSRIWSNTEVSFEDRGSGHRPRLAGSLSKLKRQGNGFLPRPSRSPCWYLHCSPVKFISDFWLPEP